MYYSHLQRWSTKPTTCRSYYHNCSSDAWYGTTPLQGPSALFVLFPTYGTEVKRPRTSKSCNEISREYRRCQGAAILRHMRSLWSRYDAGVECAGVASRVALSESYWKALCGLVHCSRARGRSTPPYMDFSAPAAMYRLKVASQSFLFLSQIFSSSCEPSPIISSQYFSHPVDILCAPSHNPAVDPAAVRAASYPHPARPPLPQHWSAHSHHVPSLFRKSTREPRPTQIRCQRR